MTKIPDFITSLARILIAVVWLAIRSAVSGDEPTRIYIANDDHTDYMWTADAVTYDRVFAEMIDFYLKLAEETKSNANEYQSRFCCDGSYWLFAYENSRSPAEFAKVVAALKSGHLSAPMTALVSCYGGQPAEAVLRGMYYAGRLERRFDLRFSMAVAMENQTLPLGLASLWAGSGAKYSWRGVCACATRLAKEPLQRRDQEIFWYTGQDGQRILMKWHSLYTGDNRSLGGYAEAFDPVAAVDFLSSDPNFLSRYRLENTSQPFTIRAAFGFGWDALDRKTGQPYLPDTKNYPLCAHFHEIAQSKSTAGQQVIVSNQEDFFRDFEQKYGTQLPSQSVALGNEWDLYSASMVETSARIRRAVEKLRSAEALATLVSLKQPLFLDGRVKVRDRAFMNLGLYWEHDWTADGPLTRSARAAWQEKIAGEIEDYVDALYRDAQEALGSLISQPAKTLRFFVLNPLSWPRSEHADIPYSGPADVHVRDVTSGVDVPHQIVRLDGASYLRVHASNVPSVGYKVYEILPEASRASTDLAATVSELGNTTIENSAVRIVLQRDGAISSLVDKAQNNRELASSIGNLRLNDLAENTDAGDELVVENAGPVSVTLSARSNAGLAHTSAITLYRNSNRIDIRNEITQNFSDIRHWSFGFALDKPSVRTEEIGCVVLNKLVSEGGDFADSNARYDHVTINHFADITDGIGKSGMTLSNADLAFARIGNSTPEKLDTQTPQINVLAGGQIDGANLGIHRQNGETRFLQRFALRPHGVYDAAKAMSFSLEHQNPLVTGMIDGGVATDFPGDSFSLLTISNPRVLLWAVKPHDAGIAKGVVVRLWNQSASSESVEIFLPDGLRGAQRITHIETPIHSMAIDNDQLSTAIPAYRMESFLLNTIP